ncbi:MAG: toll/interleukin-1 receptor domain-containing protein, partial [Bacteroidia bacterium]|nr:toll/interleukin-1 receptor domain-containing protein [Bacteroidia bacterium]
MEVVPKVKVFISYSHLDDSFWKELEKWLKLLKRNELIDVWFDRRIGAGNEFEKEIFENLRTSDIALLLVSSDFINSDYCYAKEMTFALELHEQNKLKVIPIILKTCPWTDTPLKKLKAIPKDGIPV